MPYTPGPKELAQKALRENKIRNAPKPSKADLRNKIAKVKPMTRKGGRRGR
jgi:hypothetical protein